MRRAWPYDEIRRADGRRNVAPELRGGAAAGAARNRRAATRSDRGALQSLYVGHAPATQTWRIVVWSLAAVCSIVALAFFGIPLAADRLAPLVP